MPDGQCAPACKACKKQEQHELLKIEARTAYKKDGKVLKRRRLCGA